MGRVSSKQMRSASINRMKERVRTNPRTAGTVKKVFTDRVRAFVFLTERQGHYRHSMCVKKCLNER